MTDLKMPHLKMVAALCGVLAVAAFIGPRAQANEWNEKTIFTFSQPVEIPGQVLPAGTYTFQLADSNADRDIVQIFNKNGDHVYATIMAIPDYRMQPTSKPVMTFEERPTGSPMAVEKWFYPGRLFGEEFVYNHKQATELAHRTGQPVLYTNADLSNPQMVRRSDVKMVGPNGEDVDVNVTIRNAPHK